MLAFFRNEKYIFAIYFHLQITRELGTHVYIKTHVLIFTLFQIAKNWENFQMSIKWIKQKKYIMKNASKIKDNSKTVHAKDK